ncbi:2-dehydropantoate 2-reductase [Saccharopolyspora taberi]|uniref:2-dehydropantoate 2-reductase n=1 Tax=Saccharopolyspora taberi TaxID=60895 RepID=A0ABN3VHA3_9PSEU
MIGGGAIGGILAAAAHSAGHEVSVCVRTPFERLVVDGAEVPAAIVTDPQDAPEVDWILLTTKVQDVASAAPWLRGLDNGRAPIVLVQNGVEHEESVSGLDLRGPLLPALIYVSAERVRPGQVVRRSPAAMIVPAEGPGERFPELLAEIKVSRTADFRTEAWRKMLMNLAANPITALTLRRLDVLHEPGVPELAAAVLGEAVEVARAEGTTLTQADADKLINAYNSGGDPENGTSMLYDRLAGLPTEHEHITGALVRAAARHGIPTPQNQTLLTLLRAIRPSQVH